MFVAYYLYSFPDMYSHQSSCTSNQRSPITWDTKNDAWENSDTE